MSGTIGHLPTSCFFESFILKFLQISRINNHIFYNILKYYVIIAPPLGSSPQVHRKTPLALGKKKYRAARTAGQTFEDLQLQVHSRTHAQSGT